MAFAEELKKLRIKNKISQEKLADAIGVRKSTISMYESGTRIPKYDKLKLIADYFNADVDVLMGREEYIQTSRSAAFSNDLQTRTETETSEEKNLLDLYRSVPEEKRKEVLELIEVALKMSGLKKEE